MELLDVLHNEVLKQMEEEARNIFSRVADFREFILSTRPSADVVASLKMCCVTSERLAGCRCTRVTLVDAMECPVFDSVVRQLKKCSLQQRSSRIIQLAVWDADKTKATSCDPDIVIQPGAVYQFRGVEFVGIYDGIAQGSVQHEPGNPDKIQEVWAAVRKHKTRP